MRGLGLRQMETDLEKVAPSQRRPASTHRCICFEAVVNMFLKAPSRTRHIGPILV